MDVKITHRHTCVTHLYDPFHHIVTTVSSLHHVRHAAFMPNKMFLDTRGSKHILTTLCVGPGHTERVARSDLFNPSNQTVQLVVLSRSQVASNHPNQGPSEDFLAPNWTREDGRHEREDVSESGNIFWCSAGAAVICFSDWTRAAAMVGLSLQPRLVQHSSQGWSRCLQ